MARALAISIITLASITNGETITATSTTSDTEVFDISSSNTDDDVVCTKSQCDIICDSTRSCEEVNINAELSNILNLYCINELACQRLNLLSGASQENNIQCNKTDVTSISSPCSRANFNIDAASTVDVNCGLYGCWSSKFYINNTDSVTFNLGTYYIIICI